MTHQKSAGGGGNLVSINNNFIRAICTLTCCYLSSERQKRQKKHDWPPYQGVGKKAITNTGKAE